MEKETSPSPLGLDQGSTAATTQEGISVVLGGTKLEVPPYDRDAVYYEENRSLDRDSNCVLGDLLLSHASNVLEKGRQISMTDYREVLHEVKKWNSKYMQIVGEPSTVEKPKEFWQMLDELQQSIRTSTSNREITSQEALRRLWHLRMGIHRLIYDSPWGAYLRWNELTFNQQPVVEYLAPAIQKLKESGGQALLLLVNEVFKKKAPKSVN